MRHPRGKHLNLGLYDEDIYFYKSKKLLLEDLSTEKEMDGEDVVNGSRGVTVICGDEKKKRVILIGVFDGCASTLVHELMHAVSYIAHWKGLSMDPDNVECVCYLIDYLFDEAKKRGI